MIDIIIWSKNRACQLDLLLRSIQDHFPDAGTIFILYHSTSEDYKGGYDKLKAKQFPMLIKWIQQENFETDIKCILDKMFTPYILGISDDCVFIKDAILPDDFKLENDEICFSLRHGNNHNYCLTANKEMVIPIFIREGNTIKWEWPMSDSYADYGYPSAVDSSIYDRKYITAIWKSLSFNNPCDLENEFNHKYRNYSKPYMKSFTDCRLLSIPANRTNDSSNNTFEGLTAEQLNKYWLDGIEISTENLYNITVQSCHKYIPYLMRKI